MQQSSLTNPHVTPLVIPHAVSQHDVHAAKGAIEAERSALDAIVGKYKMSKEDIVGEAGL